MSDAYEIARYVAHYHAKNGYAPRVGELHCTVEFVEQLTKNGIIEVLPLYESGPAIGVVLTDKGQRMARERR